MATTFERVQKLINTELNIPTDKITVNAHLFDDLNFDSLDAIEMVLTIETEFDIVIPDENIDELVTVQQLVTYIDANS
jgi:acyl carrier protein